VEVYETDEQRVESLKQWWRENWRSIFGGVVLGLAIVFGWRAWIGHRASVGQQASAHFEQMVAALQRGDYPAVSQQAETLRKEFATTSYAVFAALAQARAAVEQGHPEVARAALEWALANTRDSALQDVARLRLARVLLGDGDSAAAARLTETPDRGAFASEYAHLEGDIALAQNRSEAARTAYARALEAGASNRALLQMKLDQLGSPAITP
jgi:predicted negative regulator of RcsB-dependent stress response